jgi:hypothetical protein
VRGGTGGGAGAARGGSNTRWQREDLESMLATRKWGELDREADGVRAELLAQKAIYESESHGWRHPWARLSAIWGGWRRKLSRY